MKSNEELIKTLITHDGKGRAAKIEALLALIKKSSHYKDKDDIEEILERCKLS